MGYIAEFIKSLAEQSQLVAHQLLWNMKTNMYKDEDSLIKDGIELHSDCLESALPCFHIFPQNSTILLRL